MIVLQLVLFCALFTLMVKIGVGNNALNGLYFYPKLLGSISAGAPFPQSHELV